MSLLLGLLSCLLCPALSVPALVLSSFLSGWRCPGSLEILLGQFVLMIAAGHQRATSQTSVFEEAKCPLWFGLIFLKIQASLSVRLISTKAHPQTHNGSSFGVTDSPVLFPCHLCGILPGFNRRFHCRASNSETPTTGPHSAPGALSPSASTPLDSFPRQPQAHLVPALGGTAGS